MEFLRPHPPIIMAIGKVHVLVVRTRSEAESQLVYIELTRDKTDYSSRVELGKMTVHKGVRDHLIIWTPRTPTDGGSDYRLVRPFVRVDLIFRSASIARRH